MLLPTGRDAFSEALRGLLPADCNVPALTGRARDAALEHDDISLVGLAARAGDPVVLAALRESVVLYAEKILLLSGGLKYRYEWRVDPELARSANRFIEIYNRLVAGPNAALPAGARAGTSFEWCASQPIPQAEARHAPHFYGCAEDNEILGRCVHIATRHDTRENYHWAVRGASGGRGLEVDDFWSGELWTTARYRSEKRPGGTLRRGGGGIGNLEIV